MPPADDAGFTPVASDAVSAADDALVADLTPIEKAHGSRYSEIGTTGLVHTGGFVRDEFLPQLQGDRATKIYREMKDNDPVIGAMLFAVDMLARQVEWRIEPPEAASVEEIVAQRQEERAKAIAAAQAAAAQKQEMAEMAAQGLAGKGGPGMEPGKPPSDKEAVTKIRKALERWDIDPAMYDLSLLLAKAESAPNDPGGSEGKGKGGKGKAKSAPSSGPPNAPVTPDQASVIDPMEAAKVDGEEIAVFIETCFDDMVMSWPDTLSTILSMLPYGFHVAEVVYKKRSGVNRDVRKSSKYDDGKIGWRKFAPRAQETRHRWDIDPDDSSIRGMWQLDPYSGKGLVFIPWEKMLLFRTTSERLSPEGRSLLRNSYRPWFFKRRIEEIEAIGVERDLAGLPVAYVPYQMMSPSASVEEQAALDAIKRIVRNIRRDEQEGVVFPMAIDPETKQKMYDLTLLSTGGSRQFDTDKIVARYDQRISMTVLADFILLGHEQVGSFALGKTKADMFTSALEAWLDAIADVINTYAIPRLLRVNGMDPAMAPKLVHGRLNQVDLAGLGGYIAQLAQAGAPLFPDDALEGYLRDVAGLPDKEGGDLA